LREIQVREITAAVERLCQEANYFLGEDIIGALQKGLQEEISPLGKDVFRQLLENAQLAREERMPLCQDTGTVVLFIDLGQDVRLVGGDFNRAINEGVRRGYLGGFLRNSIVDDPLGGRVNTGDNTPAIVHLRLVPGEKVKLVLAPKGGGSENMSAVRMLAPAQGAAGLTDFVVETVCHAGANPCPPVVVGVGLGGNFEEVALLAKRALLRPLGRPHPQHFYADLEKEMLEKINRSGIGPQGFGGRFTALAVHLETAPCHIASLPAAVNMNCHAARHALVEL
jgi:fumarate hydratase subunit alpha